MSLDLDRISAWWQANWPMLRVPVGAVLALVLLVLLARRVRTSGVSAVAASIATPLVLAWEAQGVFTLARMMGVPVAPAVVLSGVTGAVLVTLASRAHEHYKRHNTLGPNGRLVWVVATPMGLVVALSAHSLAEGALRIILPLLAATVWWSQYLPDEPHGITGTQRRGTWRWTPRRIGVTLGLLDPTDMDLDQVHAERQVRRLTATAHKLHHGGRIWRGLRAARLRRLGLLATAEMVAEVARRVELVHQIEGLTRPGTVALEAPNRLPANDNSADSAPARKTTAAGKVQRGSTAERVAKVAARMPTATPAQIAAKAGVSERTVQRYRSQANSGNTSESVADLATATA
ncbi:MAG TPA: hypothetical protein VFC19_45520 [Candidatus Limnocylindrales bacterium]|nr:hypothetical protein [Candidatus Limnocylindrales bacterium]